MSINFLIYDIEMMLSAITDDGKKVYLPKFLRLKRLKITPSSSFVIIPGLTSSQKAACKSNICRSN